MDARTPPAREPVDDAEDHRPADVLLLKIYAKSDHIAARKRRGSAGGRPHTFDAETYKDRNVVERSFNRAKQWRGLATRYAKLAITYRAAATIFAILTWLRT